MRSAASGKGGLTDMCKRCKVLPNVIHNALGTLYEEPCVVYIRVRQKCWVCKHAVLKHAMQCV